MPDSNRSQKLTSIGVITAIVLGLYFSSIHSYLLFHSLIEIITIAVAFALFILTWNARRYLENDYLRLLGIGYAFIAFVDLLHTLAYKGMNVFPGYGANLPTQLWIAARYLQAVTLFAAPFFVERRVDNRVIFGGYATAITVLIAMVYSGNFPDCFVEGKGLTAFKIGSEYVITSLILASLYFLFRQRKHFNDRTFLLTVSSVVCTALSEISFTAYVSVYGFANLVGHFSKLAAFYLIYRAILVTGFKEPFELIFRDLKQAERELEKSRDTLEEKVRERTGALHRLNRELRAISNCNQTLMRAEDEQTLLNDICHIICDEAGYRMAWVGYAENDDAKTIRPVAKAGVEDDYLSNANITWADTERGRGPTGIAIRTGKTDCIQDFATESKAAPWRDSALQRGYCSSISLPLKDESKNTFGALTIYSTELNAFTPDEIRLMEELAGDLAFGITTLRTRAERKKAEESAAASQKLLQDVIDNSSSFIYACDLQGRFILVNRSLAFLLGAQSESLIGKTREAILPPEVATTQRDNDLKVIADRKPIVIEEKNNEPDGEHTYLSVKFPLIDPQGHVQGVGGISTDITKRKKAEEEILKLNKELDQRVKQRTAELEEKNRELEKMNKLFVGRELKMVEMKERIKELEGHQQ